MITSAKNYTKKKNRIDRTLGQMVKAKLYRQNHTQKQTYTHSQKREKGKNSIGKQAKEKSTIISKKVNQVS